MGLVSRAFETKGLSRPKPHVLSNQVKIKGNVSQLKNVYQNHYYTYTVLKLEKSHKIE